MSRLTVLQVAYPFAPVSRDAVGGAEQIVAQLDAALTAAGHHSVVVARSDSRVAGTLVETPVQSGLLDDPARERAWSNHQAAVVEALWRWPVDVVHLHGCDFDQYLPRTERPVLVTLHLPLDRYSAAAFRRPGVTYQCVSRSQQRSHPVAAHWRVIENGIPVEDFAARHAKREFVIMLGRICPEKGFHLGLDAAQRAATPAVLGGEVFAYPAHRQYFETEIIPRLGGPSRYLGPLGFARKRRWLSAARCLLAPSLVAETCSLVALEALACGTPVVAFRAGALVDWVEPGRTGFLVDDTAGMAEAIRGAGTLDPAACRAMAGARASADRMTAEYLAVYHELRETVHAS